MIEDTLIHYSQELRAAGLYRKRQLVCSPKPSLNFSSNDYLSLTMSKRLKKSFQQGFEKYPSGSGGSMVVCGYHPMHQTLEEAFSHALNTDDALLFSSGYAANLGIISLLTHLDAHLYIDKGLHASFYDGIQLNKISYTRFLHNNLQDLQAKLTRGMDNAVIISEGIFSMSGQLAPLTEMASLGKKNHAKIIVDEAHSFGILGPQGLGAVAQHQLTPQEVPLRVIPFGKSLGAQGAIVVGEGQWIDALLQSARSYIYSTAVSPALTYGVLETLMFILEADSRRKKLFQLIDYFRKAIKSSPLTWQHSQTPIQQLQLGCPRKALYYTEQLKQRGIFCQSIREPTVSRKHTGLRVILNYHHEPEDIDALFLNLKRIYESEY
ncbi:aminotransferase class I/II-fold pyridoxal phosphate-dependent enzyme [Legionella clemsonensis]|uniref:8-amino-7-oxononanoate synthase n=1 Tax=Legionella clemsonensis TaxID=1867846 RepID=A0A222P2C5_9GAMM|nr:aminotransferase class I/II-fold pyridoxal phosphate-dependent enzyme [Legionella clemsonensis]ASQ45915.1 8-amino-7-oxononanoate synthase [Legionella clemsonensis]